MNLDQLDQLDSAAERLVGLDEQLTESQKYVIPTALKMRINGLLEWAAADRTRMPAVTSQNGLARVAVRRFLEALEADHNDGHPFPAREPGARKRGTRLPKPSARISIIWPVSLFHRMHAAAEWLAVTGTIPEITSANRLVIYALDHYVDQVEQAHHDGNPFHDARIQLAPGRPAHH